MSLLTGLGSVGDGQGDTLSSIENIIGSALADALTGNGVVNILDGHAGNDALKGGAGNDTLSGGSDTDAFVFDGTAFTPAQPGSASFDRILDYDQGNTGTFSLAEDDALDLSALLSTAYSIGQSVSALVRVLESPSGTTAILQIDQDGAANGMNWTTIARLDGIHPGNGVRVILDPSQPAGTTLTAPALAPIDNFNGDGHSDILWQNADGTPAVWLMDGTTLSCTDRPSASIRDRAGTSRTPAISTATARPTSSGRTTTARRRSG